ncbi:hypothetical protein CKM354_000072000 [Cercospora kikuchii]|uniref:Mid2 domain-containing protein n=1 Tax=Cercospora kikuchii TaxID=84275 RepID=A0A9P3C9I3_9PEZI|nr:uncharacterized protein CKM354_000072000 [Cercospora kikuchii]GIZ37267.1 hypothetical protein CKM354_000072000 [Cercospora kikuchii]
MSRFALLASLVITLAHADYTEWYFSGNNSCPGLGIACNAPDSLCAYDSVVDKYYCCSGASYNVCRAFAADCGGSNGEPSSSQQECTSDSVSWCCLDSRESCTQRTGQINVCIASQDNPIGEVPQSLINETYASLSSASPSASTFSVDVASLVSRATATSTSSSATTTSTSSPTSTASETASPPSEDSDSGVSGGTIAGAVVGGVAGLALIGALVWFLLRRRARHTHAPVPTSPTGDQAEKHDHFGAVSPGYSTPAPEYHLSEMEGTREIKEMPGGAAHQVKELPSEQSEPRELPA